MFPLNLKSSIGMALICFILGCCTAFLLTANCNGTTKQPTATMAMMLKTQADSLHAYYHATIAELENRNKLLNADLQSTKAELNEAKAKTHKKAAEIKKMLNRSGYPAKELLKKPPVSFAPVDTALQKCDSLALLVADYLDEDEYKDSLYEMHISQQDSLMTGKDAIIAIQESENMNLSFLLKQSLTQQTLLEKDNLVLSKKIKRQRSAGRWLAFGSTVLTGLVTHYFYNR